MATDPLLTCEAVLAGGSICAPLLPGYHSSARQDYWRRYSNEKEAAGWSQQDIESEKQLILTRLDHVYDILDKKRATLAQSYFCNRKLVFIAQGGQDTLIDPSQARALKAAYSQAEV